MPSDPIFFFSFSVDLLQNMRYANSLESLDAVSTSIQHARAHSQQKHYVPSSAAVMQVAHPTQRASGSTDAIHQQQNILYSRYEMESLSDSFSACHFIKYLEGNRQTAVLFYFSGKLPI